MLKLRTHKHKYTMNIIACKMDTGSGCVPRLVSLLVLRDFHQSIQQISN